MATEIDRVAAAQWRHRSKEFGAVREYDDGRPIVVMELAPEVPLVQAEAWGRLRELWLDLPVHPNLLDAVEHLGDRGLLLRYAALDWAHRPIRVEGSRRRARMFTAWGAQLAHVFAVLSQDVAEAEVGRLLRPFAKIDLEGHVRVGFLPATPADPSTTEYLAPEVRACWPRCDERGLVFLVGKLLSRLWVPVAHPTTEDLASIIERCLDPEPGKRYRTLMDLRQALIWQDETARAAVRQGAPLVTWDLVEAGIGSLAIQQPARALASFEEALDLDPSSHLAQTGRHTALDQLGEPRRPYQPGRAVVAPAADLRVPWSEAERQGLRLERERAFAEALALYRSVRSDDANTVDVALSRARCHLALGEAGHAIDYAQRGLTADPSRVDARSIIVRGFLLRDQPGEALRCAEELVEICPTDGIAHYARGRCLLALGRLVEARESFERATELAPQLLEAMLLRREVDRCLRGVRDRAGTQPTMALELPEQLAELKSVLVNGRTTEAIQILRRPDYERDAVAQLILAHCLRLEGRHAEAAIIYERVATAGDEHRQAALLGKACALLDLDRAAEALEIFDLVCSRSPDDVDAIEGRARALERLGRADEAAQEIDRLIALANGRSDLRVRSAQLWLSRS